MSIVPFLFFTLLTVYWWRQHRGLDVCTYMSGMFAFTSLLSFLIVAFDQTQGTGGSDSGGMLWAGWEPKLGFVPTAIYCIFIGVAIMPFSFIHVRDIKRITVNAPWTLLGISALLIGCSLVSFYCVADSTLDILSGDLAAVRTSSYLGEQTPADIKAEGLPFPLGYLTYLNFSTTLAMPIMFYNVCYGNKPWWWNTLLFFASMTPIMVGIQRVDRTEPVFFAIMLLFCIVFFRHAFSRRFRIIMRLGIFLLALVGFAYIATVSMARFDGSKNGDATTSVLQYGGQNYLNFCYFWENASYDEVASEREFPLINHFVSKIDSNADRRGDRSARQGFFISVFASFIGDILLDLGPVGLTAWIVFYVLLTLEVIKWRRRTEYDISEVLIIFLLAAVPLFGIFYYRYFQWMIAINYVVLIIFRLLSKYKFVYSKETDDK
ncbi:MAG: hypothetical protein KBT20_07005 [Bacteroidales bacterium]|nr:hypothetical protein [Candidatus Liminaster caballi]